MDYFFPPRIFSCPPSCRHILDFQLGCGAADIGLERSLALQYGFVDHVLEAKVGKSSLTYIKVLDYPKLCFTNNDIFSFPAFVDIHAEIRQYFPQSQKVCCYTSIYSV